MGVLNNDLTGEAIIAVDNKIYVAGGYANGVLSEPGLDPGFLNITILK